jgi:TolB-like protein
MTESDRIKYLRVALVVVGLIFFGLTVGALIWKGESVNYSDRRTIGLAVLPFESLNQDKEDAFFAEGLYDGVSTRLARVANLKVISHNSVAKSRGARNAREIGRALNVAYVLEGSVCREARMIHLNAQLTDTRADAHIWAQEYDRDLNCVFALQGEIAQKVADRLRAKATTR